MKQYEQKKQWILDYMQNPNHKYHDIDIFGEEFVDAYINQFNPQTIYKYAYGVPAVPELGRILSKMFKEGLLQRFTVGCKIWRDGYPKWFYTYLLPQGKSE